MNKTFFCIDASVILKWFLRETEDQEEALALQQDFFNGKIVLGMPHYALAEILNVFGQKLPPDEVIAFINRILNFGIEEYPIDLEMANTAIQIMQKYRGVTFYDAGYHAVALNQDGVFATADEAYYKRVQKEGGIMLLKDYGKKR